MRHTRRLLHALALSFLAILTVAPTRADQAWRTPLRLAEPTEVPGKVLPAGDYVVKVIDTQQTRSIVQFLNASETEVAATVLAVPNYSVQPAEETQFFYFQRAEGYPQALKSWVYPGNNYGVEFVYPRAEALVLAERTKETVYATPAPEPALRNDVVAVTPEKREMPIAETPAPSPARHGLPKTASDFPLLGFLAAASLAGAAGLKFLGRRIG